ncbi:MAG: hypothetical protein IK001_07700 [Lachnospiraceae bacterium]|nr:hypothetical protein [Lachnospiraceae bacterium]
MAIFSNDKQTVAQMTADITEGISASIAESVTKAMGPVFEKLAGEIKTALSATTEEQKKASESLVKNIAALEKAAADMSAATGQMNKAIEDEKAYSAKLAQERGAQESRLVEFEKKLEAKQNAIAADEDKSRQQFETQKAELAKAAEDVKRQREEGLAAVAAAKKEQEAALESGRKSLEESIESRRSALAEQEKALAAQCEQALSATQSIQKQLKDTADGFGTAVQGASNMLGEKLSVAAQQLGEKMAASADNAGDRVKASADGMAGSLGQLNELIAKLESGIAAMQSCASAMDATAKNMEAGLTKYNQGLSDGMDQFRSGIQGSVAETFKIIDQQLAQAAGTLGTSANDIAEAAAKIPKAIRGLE